MQRRQELEQLDAASPDSPLLPQAEAVKLIERGDRSVGVLTYGWLCPQNPDPKGDRLRLVHQALKARPRIEGLFWDYPSLHQHPKNGDRTAEEDKQFLRGIEVMGVSARVLCTSSTIVPSADAHSSRFRAGPVRVRCGHNSAAAQDYPAAPSGV